MSSEEVSINSTPMNHFGLFKNFADSKQRYACGKRLVVGGHFDYDLAVCPTCEAWHDEHGGHYTGWMAEGVDR